MLALAIFVAVVMLIPVGLFLVGRIRDPFHPLIFAGVVSFAISPDRLIRHPGGYQELLDASHFNVYLVISLLSMLGLYLGWYYAGRVKNRTLASLQPAAQYSPTAFILVAIICIAIAIPIHFLYRRDSEIDVSGYVKDWGMLWITAAILLVQAFFLTSSKSRILIVPLLLLSLIPPIERFLYYGQRGDTFRVASLAMLAYLMIRRRPSKPVLIVGILALGLLLSTLASTRKIVEDGEAPDRIHAIARVLPKFFNGELTECSQADECVFGAAAVGTVRANHTYGYGLGYTAGLFIQFTPRQIFPNKREWIPEHGGNDIVGIANETGVIVPTGSAPSGFANSFFELGWACPIVWMILGYFYRRHWDRAVEFNDIRHTGLLVAFTMAMLYAITQDVFTAEMNMIDVMIPLVLVYRFARCRTTDEAPALVALSA
jgi:hypothetical protein